MLSPPRALTLQKMIEQGSFPAPQNCEIHVGSEDWQSNPKKVFEFGQTLKMRVVIAAGLGHRLGHDYVGRVLDNWLSNGSPS